MAGVRGSREFPEDTMSQRLPPIEPRRLYRQIATILREWIDAGRFPVGSLLPPERDLAEQLGGLMKQAQGPAAPLPVKGAR